MFCTFEASLIRLAPCSVHAFGKVRTGNGSPNLIASASPWTQNSISPSTTFTHDTTRALRHGLKFLQSLLHMSFGVKTTFTCDRFCLLLLRPWLRSASSSFSAQRAVLHGIRERGLSSSMAFKTVDHIPAADFQNWASVLKWGFGSFVLACRDSLWAKGRFMALCVLRFFLIRYGPGYC